MLILEPERFTESGVISQFHFSEESLKDAVEDAIGNKNIKEA